MTRNMLTALLVFLAVVSGQIQAEAYVPEKLTWEDVRNRYVVKQQYDFSCGIASLLTILKNSYGVEMDEREILKDFVATLDEEEKANVFENGLSLAHLKEMAEQQGYNAYPRKLSVSDLKLVKRPAMVYVEKTDFKHFAVLMGVNPPWIYLADPSRGYMTMRVEEFIEEWKGRYLMFIDDPKQQVNRESYLAFGEEVPLPAYTHALRHLLLNPQ